MWGLYVSGYLMDLYYSKDDVKWAYMFSRSIYGYGTLIGMRKFPKNWAG